MNVIALIQVLEEAVALYEELKQSGLLDQIEASVAKDKEILAALDANPKVADLVGKLASFVGIKQQ